MTKKFIFKLFFIFCLLEYSNAIFSDDLQCFVPGHCMDSHLLEAQLVSSVVDCLTKCKEKGPECAWFSFLPGFGLCQLLANCSRLDTSQYPDSVSGERECSAGPPPEPKCWIPGACSGTVINIVSANTKEDCLTECKNNRQCNWFTFVSTTSACELLSNCQTLDSSCSVCISGERTCDDVEIQGNVAFVVGGDGSFAVEIYSPEGGCQFVLKSVPDLFMSEFWRPVLAYISDKILACGGSENNRYCWVYDTENDEWNDITFSGHSHNHQPGAVYEGKLYMLDEKYPEVYDPISNTWNSWPKAIESTGDDPCLLTWKSAFILIGGKSNPRNVQAYSHTDQSWTVLGDNNVPMEIHNSACIVLPNDDILVVGSENFDDYYSASIFNVPTNSWTKLERMTSMREGSSLVSLTDRIFLIGGLTESVEEFHPEDNSWTPVSPMLKIPRTQHSSISLPASIFTRFAADGCQGIS